MVTVEYHNAMWLEGQSGKWRKRVYYIDPKRGLMLIPPQRVGKQQSSYDLVAVYAECGSGRAGQEAVVRLSRDRKIAVVSGGFHPADELQTFEPYAIKASNAVYVNPEVALHYATDYANTECVYNATKRGHVIVRSRAPYPAPTMRFALHPDHDLVVAPLESEEQENA